MVDVGYDTKVADKAGIHKFPIVSPRLSPNTQENLGPDMNILIYRASSSPLPRQAAMP